MGISGRSSKEHLFARRIADQLMKTGMVSAKQKQDLLCAKIESILTAQSQIESKLDTETKELLKKYETEIDRGAVDTHKMFLMIKKKLIRDRNLILQGDPTLSQEDKTNHLAHVLQEGLMHDSDIEKTIDATGLLAIIKKILIAEMEHEKEIHDLVRSRLSGGKILEGSEEWNLVYQRTLSEIMKKRGME